jgi:predicted DNA-binding protein
VRCALAAVRRSVAGMSNRFELRLPADTRRELTALADRTGLPSATLARLAIRKLIDDPTIALLPADRQREREAA